MRRRGKRAEPQGGGHDTVARRRQVARMVNRGVDVHAEW